MRPEGSDEDAGREAGRPSSRSRSFTFRGVDGIVTSVGSGSCLINEEEPRQGTRPGDLLVLVLVTFLFRAT